MERTLYLEIADIFAEAIDFEHKGERFYREEERLTHDLEGKRMFAKLAGDEAAHAYWLEKWRAGLLATGSIAMLSQQLLNARLGGLRKIRFPAPTAFARSTPDANRLDALNRGIQTEVESRDFYKQAAGLVKEGQGKAIFAHLAEIEEQHRVLLQGEYDYLTNTGIFFGLPDFTLEALVE
jgi:rubrerythrin